MLYRNIKTVLGINREGPSAYELVYITVSVPNHFLNIAKVGNACRTVISLVNCIDDSLILFEELVIQKTKDFNAFKRHFYY